VEVRVQRHAGGTRGRRKSDRWSAVTDGSGEPHSADGGRIKGKCSRKVR
jgi:hypothetical protein